MNTKKWIFSKTIWIGILEIISGLATAIAGQLEAGIPLTITGIVMIVLRLVTKSGVSK